ncbi:unnamed protein product [Staurois parvus]|uniref:Uncharacterized protein n=1 Tax=Staurois parvus TaxID=386267 RepID=A0ABN9D1S1_9NEOB|nr:unnamed protein product [Staurois parvus]
MGPPTDSGPRAVPEFPNGQSAPVCPCLLLIQYVLLLLLALDSCSL